VSCLLPQYRPIGPDRGMLKTASGHGYRLVWALRQESTSSADSIDLEPVRSPAEPIQTNLPAAASDLIGRTTAVQHLCELLAACRVVTLTGAGGIGKTKPALEVVRGLLPSFQGDVRPLPSSMFAVAAGTRGPIVRPRRETSHGAGKIPAQK
jgi:hypothetical protein